MSSAPDFFYHLVPTAAWAAAAVAAAGAGGPDGAVYYPPTYTADGFTHLAADPAPLLAIANHFYTREPGAFVVVVLAAARLPAGAMRWEPSAPVGDTPARLPPPPAAAASPDAAAAAATPPLFPHLYAGIPVASAVAQWPVTRDPATGAFLAILEQPVPPVA